MLDFSFSVIVATGFAGSIGQILILRELLVLFYGNELSTGLVLAAWLFWTAAGSRLAGRMSRKHPATMTTLARGLILLALLLPLTLFWIRASRLLWSIPAGEMVPPGLMVGISLSSTCLFCLTSGFLFAFAWSVRAAEAEHNKGQGLLIYLGDAAGAAAGGLCFHFILVSLVSALTAALAVSALALAVSAHVFLRVPRLAVATEIPSFRLKAAWLALVGLTVAGLAFSADLDNLSRAWQWGPNLLAVRDTPYHNLALKKDSGQFTLFANGLWLFTIPDPQTAEYAVHPALLQHPSPRKVLIVGGGAGGFLGEILKHPDIERVDCVEQDPEIFRLAEELMPAFNSPALHDPRVHLFHEDAGSFIRRVQEKYDVILLNPGDPMNAEVNRFYTVEFYRSLTRIMDKGGLLSFAVASAPDIVGQAQARYLRSVYATLSGVFPEVLVLPGESARFIASQVRESLVKDPTALITRMAARKLRLQYIREYTLLDDLNPLRLEYMASILREGPPPALNKDFSPTCYLNGLIVWSAQMHPLLEKALTNLAQIGRSWLWGGLAVLILAGLALFGRGMFRCEGPGQSGFGVVFSVMVVGGAQMALEIILLLAFQIMEGFVYTELALIISFFMAGAALGAAIPVRLSRRIKRPLHWLILVQTAFTLFIPGILVLLFTLQQQIQNIPHAAPLTAVLFPALALLAGIQGGCHFALAVKTLSGTAVPSARLGAGLYAADLMGSAIGALASSLFLLPVYGLATTMAVFSVLSLASAFILAPHIIRG